MYRKNAAWSGSNSKLATINLIGVTMDIDLDIAFKKLRQLELQDGDLGAVYWHKVGMLLRDADQHRERALAAEEQVRRMRSRKTKPVLSSRFDPLPGSERYLLKRFSP
jgi:hypothetical protein